MRTNDFEKILSFMGYVLARNSSHRVWSKARHSITVPHAKELNRMVAKRLLKEIGYTENVPQVGYKFKEIEVEKFFI